MDPIVLSLGAGLGAAAFIGVAMLAFGAFGRPDPGRPTCVGCGADVRPLAWEDRPRCACGAALERPGTVRTRGRIRRPRLAVAGAALLVLVAVATGVAGWLVGLEHGWRSVVPFSALTESGPEGRVRPWAYDELVRRLESGDLGPERDAEAFAALVRTAADPQSPVMVDGEVLAAQHLRWRERGMDAEAILPLILDPAWVADDSAELLRFVAHGLLSDQAGAGFRVERVTVDGMEVPFELVRDPSAAQWWGRMPRLGRRFATAGVALRLPQGWPRAGSTVVVEGTLASMPGVVPAAPGDPIIDPPDGRLTDPATWGVGARVVHSRLTVETGPPPAAEPGP